MYPQFRNLNNFERFISFVLPQPICIVLQLGILKTMVSVSMDYSGEAGKTGLVHIPPHLNKLCAYKCEVKLKMKLVGDEDKIHAERMIQRY